MPVLKAGIDSRGAKVGANQFNSSLDSMKRKVRETGASMDRFGRDSYASLSLMKAGIMGVVASLTSMGVIMGAMRFAQFAMQVEAMRISMEAAAGGAEQARKELSFLRVEAGRLGLAFQDQVGAYKGLLAASRGTRLEGEKTRQIFLGIAEAGTALQLTTDEMNGILLATQQIMSKGKVQAEELRGQIGERLPGAFSVAAKAMNMTTAELDKFMSQGKLTAEDFLPKFAAALREHYSGALEKSTDSLRSNVNRMTTAWAAFKTAIVDVAGMEGTNTVLKKITSTIKELTEVVKENRGPIDNFISGFANSSKIIGGFAKDYSALGMTLKSIDLMKMAWDESFMTDIDRLRKGLKDVSDDILKLDTARQNAYKNMTQINKDAPGGILSPDDERRVKALYSQTQVLNKSILDLMNIKVKLNKLFEAETNVEKMTGDLAKLDDEIEHYIQLRKGSIDDIAKLKDAMAEGTAPHSSVGAPARQYQLLQQEVLDIERVLGVLQKKRDELSQQISSRATTGKSDSLERIKKDIEETKQLLEAANWDYDEIADYKLEAYIEDYEALAEQREKDAEHLARTEEENARILERKLKEQLEIRKAFIEKMNKMPVEYYAAEYEDDVYIDAEIRTRKYRMSNADYWNQEDEAPGHYEDSANTYEDAMVNAFENVGDAYVDMLSDMDGNWKDMVASMSVTISKVFSSEVIDATVGEGMQDIIKRFKAGDQTWGDYAAAAGMAGVLLSRFIGNKNERMRVNAAGTGAVTGAGWGSKMGGNSGGGGWATAIGAIIGAIAGYIGTEKQKDWKQYITPEHQGWYDMGRGIQDISEMTQKRGGDDRTRIAIVAGIDSMREGMYNQAQIIAESVPVEFRQALMESIGSAEFGMGGKGWVIRQSHQIEDMEALMEAVQKSMWEAIGPQLIEGATSMIDGFDASRMSAGSPIAGLIESVQAGVQDGNIDQYIKDLMELTQAINDADMAWETITESIDKVLNGSTAYENALDSLDLKYEEYEEALVNLGFSAEAIAEIMANKALEIDELERVFAEDRANITSEIDYYIAGLTDTMSNLEKEIFQVDQSFDSWIDRMEELGASEEDLALIEAKRIQVIQALAEAQLDMIRQTQSEIGGYDQDHRLRQIGGRYGWGDEYYSEEGGANWENIFRDAIQGFVTGSAAQIVQTADRFGVTIEQLIGDITWLNDVIEEMRAEMQALIDSIKANLDQVRNSMEYANWQGTPQAFYMQNIKSAMGAESFSLEDLLSISDDLVDWWNAAIQQEIMVAQQWGQVASITESLINSIDAVIKSIKYSSLNVALPGQKADLAGQDYATLRAAAFGPDATQEDLQAFINFTQTFLQQQQNAFKSSDEYQRVYAEVMRDLGLAQDLVQTEDFQKKIYEQLVEMTENVDFSDIKSTFDEIADWIEAQISEIEKGIMITVGFEGLDEDAATALGLLEGIVAEHGWNASLTLDFITNFLAGNTEILWREFRDLLEDMGADSSTVKMIEAIYNDQASSFTWEELNNLLETEGIQPDIITRLRGEYQNDGLSLTELEDILASGGLPNEVIRRIVAELKTDVEVEVSPQFTAINERLKDIRDNTKETYLRLSGNQSGQYRSINSKLASIMSSASRIASNTSNIGAFASSSNYAPMIVGRDNTEKDELKKQTAILEAMLDKPMQVTVEVGGEEFETLIDRRADRVVVKREQGGYSDGRKML